jgi:outer membrane receptor protein involved in Fe transport
LLLLAGVASAQTKKAGTRPVPPPPPASSGQGIASVTVAAERPSGRIDRQVYDVKNDTSGANDSAAEALNKLPSVNVDPDGAVQLRGSSKVTILVDGKPSAMMQGEGRGAALLAIPAADLDSVEVINNPGAEFGNDGGGGPIINLVMKRIRRPGGSASLSANAGTQGRHNAWFSGNYNQGPWGFQGGLNIRRDGRASTLAAAHTRIIPRTGVAIRSTQDGSSSGLNDSAGLNGSLTYNLGQNDTLGANLALMRRSDDSEGLDHYRSQDAAGALSSDYVRTMQGSGSSGSFTLGARWDHKGGGPGEILKLDFRISGSDRNRGSAYRNDYALRPAAATERTSQSSNDNSRRISDFTGDYEKPVERGMLKLGYKFSRSQDETVTAFSDYAARGNSFRLVESVYALYGSYQLRLGERWGLLGGLRMEYTDADIEQLTSNIRASNGYLDFIPSAFATYRTGGDANIRFSYAHRIKRPTGFELNPFVVYYDEFNVASGNPKLRPTQTDSFEVGLETSLAGLNVNARAYYSRDEDAILDRKFFISDTVLLTTRDNAGGSNNGGLEVSASGKLAPGLAFNASCNMARREIGFYEVDGSPTRRAASGVGGKINVKYQLTESDEMQLTLQNQGRSLAGQGYRKANATTNLSLRHNFSPAVAMVFNVSDLFEQNRMETVTQTSVLDSRLSRRYEGRVIYLGLTYRFSTVNPRAPGSS